MNQKALVSVYGKIPEMNLGQLKMLRDVDKILKNLIIIREHLGNMGGFPVRIVIPARVPTANDVWLLFQELKRRYTGGDRTSDVGLAVEEIERLLRKLCTNKSSWPRIYHGGKRYEDAYGNFWFEERDFDYYTWFVDGFSKALRSSYENQGSDSHCRPSVSILSADEDDLYVIFRSLQKFRYSELQRPLGSQVTDEVIEWLYRYRAAEAMALRCERDRDRRRFLKEFFGRSEA